MYTTRITTIPSLHSSDLSQPLTTCYKQQANAVSTDLAMISEATVAVPRKLTKCAAPPTEADWDNTDIAKLDSSVPILYMYMHQHK